MPLAAPGKMPRRQSVLVTGGSGFIGTRLVPELIKVFKHVVLYDKDVRSIDRYEKKFDVVCHLAGICKVRDESMIGEMFDVNCFGTLAVLDYCRRTGAACVLASSAAVYAPIALRRKLKEDAATEPVLAYGASKLLAEKICRHESRIFSIDLTILRVFNVYGEGQREPYIIPYVVNSLKSGKSIVLNRPDVVRDFIHVSDVARAFVSACSERRPGFRVYNVGTGKGERIRDVAAMASKLFGSKFNVAECRLAVGGVDAVIADVGRIYRDLGWRPSVKLEEGLLSVIRPAGCL